ITEAVLSDETGSIKAIWFNQPYLVKTIKTNDEYFFAGTVDALKGLQLQNPVFEEISEHPLHTCRIVPVYKLDQFQAQKKHRARMYQMLKQLTLGNDTLPESLLKKFNILGLEKALKYGHFPPSLKHLFKAQERLAFEEVFLHQLAGLLQRHELDTHRAPQVHADIELIKAALQHLPFELTQSQKKAIWEIAKDLEQIHPMNRLLQGDVGSGKTIVAILGSISALALGFQIVVLAPTEVLARQHHKTISDFFGTVPFTFKTEVILFTR